MSSATYDFGRDTTAISSESFSVDGVINTAVGELAATTDTYYAACTRAVTDAQNMAIDLSTLTF